MRSLILQSQMLLRLGSRFWTAVAVCLTVAATWLYAHEGHVALPSRGATVDAAKGFIVLSRESRDALNVQAAEIVTRPLPDYVSAYAAVVSPWQSHAFASSRLAGRISQLFVQPGQLVSHGQVLADVVSPDLEALQLEILNGKTEQRLAAQIVAVLRDSAGSVSEQSILEAEMKLASTANALEVGKAKWRGLGLDEADLTALLDTGRRLASYPVRTPITGTIIHADLALGKVLDPGEHVCEIVDLSRVLAKVDVLEKDLTRVSVGQAAELRFSAYPAEVFSSKIVAIDFALDPITHSNAAWVELTNPTGAEPRLLPGMTVEARIQIPRSGDARVVPASALIDDGLAQYVLVEEARAEKQSEYRRKNVVVVRRTAEFAEVRAAGILPGDRVVVQGAHELGGFFVPSVLKLSPEAEKTIGLEVATVSRHSVDEVNVIEGHVDLLPERRGVGSAPMSGNIVRILVDRGQIVRKGQALAEVYSVDLINLQLDLIREQLNFNLLRRQNESYQRAGEAFPRRKRLELEAELNASEFRRNTVRNRLVQLGLSEAQIAAIVDSRALVETVSVKSSLDGVVASFDKALGQSIKAEEPLFAIHDLTRPTIQGLVPERLVGGVRTGQVVRVRLVSDPSRVLNGHVNRSNRVLSTDDQSLKVWITLDQQVEATLRNGQLASLAIVSSSSEAVLAVPKSAILREGERTFAFVKKPDGFFERRNVVVTRSDDRFSRVTYGLLEGETVAVQGVSGLQTAYASIR